MLDVRIQAESEDLEDLRRTLLAELGPELEIQEVSSTAPGELREPVLISLVISLGPIVVKEFADVVKRWLEHREQMKELDLRIEALGERAEPTTLDALPALVAETET